MAENNLGWVAEVGNYNALNEKLFEISNLRKSELALIKKTVFKQAEKIFDLDVQIKELIVEEVF